MAKKIVTVGLKIPAHSDLHLSLHSDQSLLDYDIIVFVPDISDLSNSYGEYYQGKPCLSDSASFSLKEKALRWKQELLTAFEHGKTIFIYLPELKEVFVATGTVDYSGSGRNRVTIRHVEAFNNFKLLPLNLGGVTAARGQEMKAAKSLGILAPYWSEFGSLSRYEIYFDSQVSGSWLVTKTGDKTVGGIIRGKAGSKAGAVVLLPPLVYDEGKLIQEKDGKTYWNKSALAFGKKWISTLLEIDASIAAGTEQTPQPDWAKSMNFALQKEREVQNQIAELNARINDLAVKKQELVEQMQREGSLRNLLYETGPLLEAAIIDALGILGVKAEPYKDSISEFDVVFTWKGTRFVGEAEGKESKAINVDKISQLERNLSEDFARKDVTEYARGILFGNAFRLQDPASRGDFFTDKCLSTAERIKAALIRTPDLFLVARYAKESGDTSFGEKCIEAIASTQGTIVRFPTAPQQGKPAVVATKENVASAKRELGDQTLE
jgi:hypothetical protein